MENNFKNNVCVFMYNWITLLCTWNTVSQLYINKIHTLRKKRGTDGQQVHEIVLNNDHQGIMTLHLLYCLLLKSGEIISVGKGVEKKEPLCTVGRNVTGVTAMENRMKVPPKNKNRTTIWSSNLTSWYIPKGNKNTNPKRFLHPSVHCSIIYNSEDMEET